MIYRTIVVPGCVGLNRDPDSRNIKDDQAASLFDVMPYVFGEIRSRKWKVKQNSGWAAGANGLKLYLDSGATKFLAKVQNVLYDNNVSVAVDLPASIFLSGVDYDKNFFLAMNGYNQRYKRSAASFYKWGIAPPEGVISSAIGAAGILNGNYYYKMTYLNVEGKESVANTASVKLTVVDDQIDLSNIPVPSDPQVITKRLYRAGGTSAQYKKHTDWSGADLLKTTYTDNTADESLGAAYNADKHYPPPELNYAILHYHRIYGFGLTVGEENWLYYSEPFEPLYFGRYPYENYIKIGGSENLVAILSSFRALIAFKSTEIFVCEGTIPNEMHITPTNAKRGCSAPWSVGVHKMPIYASSDGIYGFDGRNEIKIIEYSDPIFDTELNQTYITRCVGIVHKDLYYFSYPSGANTYPSQTLVIDLKNNNGLYMIYKGFNAFERDTSGNLWGLSNDGFLYKLEQETNTDTEYLTFSYQTKDFHLGQTPGEIGGVKEIMFNIDTKGSDVSVVLSIDGPTIDTYVVNCNALTTYRKKTSARFGRYANLTFVGVGTKAIKIVPPIIINPQTPAQGGVV